MAGRGWRHVAPLLLLLVCAFQLCLRPARAVTLAEENALRALSTAWNGAAVLSWAPGADVCSWNGVTCSGDSVIALSITSAAIQGQLPGSVIAGLVNLVTLDLTLMAGLGGPLPGELGQLTQLTTLNLQGCSFSGRIPYQLGQLKNLKFLALNNNGLTGLIPNELGFLSQVYWFDVQQNQLSGELPMSSASQINIGLDNMTGAIHLHLNNNSFTGSIPPEICLLPKLNHFLVDSNKFGGTIPAAIGSFPALTILRLQYNNFVGPVPAEISKLSTLTELHLNGNSLSGLLPDLSALKNLLLLDLGDNNFTAQPFPPFVQYLTNLQSLDASNAGLIGSLPSFVFGLQSLQSLTLSNNALSGTLQFGTLGPALEYVLLDSNHISLVAPLIPADRQFQEFTLQFNPVCNGGQPVTFPPQWCLPSTERPYVKSAPNCPTKTCKDTRRLNPSNCGCYFVLSLIVQLTSPTFSVIDETGVQSFEGILAKNTSTQVVVANATFTSNGRLRMETEFFSIDGRDLEFEIANAIVNNFTNQEIGLPGFAPYLVAIPPFPLYPPKSLPGKSSSLGIGAIIGIIVAALVVGLVVAAIAYYALRQKKRADKAEEMSKPFGSWPGGKTGDSGGAPQLKGARWFSFSELKKATGNFSESNEIGVGGYGKVYKGKLETGEVVAIKRAQEGSMQGQTEFKNEIELLSRVHHRNLVGLVGFCYEQGEQLLVYEFMPNGTMRDHLVGKGEASLDWNRRLSIALGSARGLAYLHDLANPPIIHRDIKSSNILLDEKLIAKVADFGLSKLNPDGGGKTHVSTQVKGTLGYLDPEYYMTQQLSDKSDVYSFGVVLLELLTARQPIERGKYIVREVKTALDRGGMTAFRDLLDPFLTDYNVHDLKTFLDLALRCVEEAAADRPTMSEVARDLEVLAGHSHPDSGHVSVNVSDMGKNNVKPR